MRTINSIDELHLPEKYKNCIREYLNNISILSNIYRVILFGSCAREAIHKYSDIDIFIIMNDEVSDSDEMFLMCDTLPKYKRGNYISMDIIVNSKENYNKYKKMTGMVQKFVEVDGVDLSGLLQISRISV